MAREVPRVPEHIDFPREEERVLEFWKEIDAFGQCLKQSRDKPRYSFYDGPPFATGLPHYGHILAGTIKDVVTRYAHQQGFHVERRFGWDCHGLPVEFEIDKLLGVAGPEDVQRMGIDKYNAECRGIVMRYAQDWERIVTRIGRWIDFKNDYKTLYPWFMESVWWVFKELYNKGLVYRGVKVMPFSTACSTPLSNFEAGQNYKEVVDPAVVVAFPVSADTSLLAWTTTPWTLPSNLALCVHPALTYLKIKDRASGKHYILQESRFPTIFKNVDDFHIVSAFPGIELKGMKYSPPFDYFVERLPQAHCVLTDTYVTEDSGTGVVHQAPYFGEDDYRVCLAAGVITRDQEVVCPVDASGRFTAPVSHFEGQYVKDADKNIIAHLKKNDRLVQSSQTKHSYPFCWRSETPLIYKAVPSWFIRVEQMSGELLRASAATHWVPDFVKDKRFGNWLKDARDWAVSRNRYWGTPIPLWISPDQQEVVCVGSVEELSRLTGKPISDLHRESIDHLEIPSSRAGAPPLKRVSEVFDCWFESGSMPYAQCHYPFENKKEFEDRFPADFIAEGIDQTRGWFYTLIVLSTALFNKAPFKNLIANGLVLASDGQKMSKRKKNYPDPLDVVRKYGADALRLYLINSPVVRAENLRFKEEGVRDVIKDVFLPWYNAYRFLIQNVERIVQEDKVDYSYGGESRRSDNVMDRWIVSFTQSLIEFVKREMAAYRLYTVVPRLTRFIDQLTNWYVRMNRRRLKGETGVPDCLAALDTLYGVLADMVGVMAPFTPFLSELMYRTLRRLRNTASPESVHFTAWPAARAAAAEPATERAVRRMQAVLELGRVVRERRTLPAKYPLPEMVVIHRDPQYLADVHSLERYVLEEMNVRRLVLTGDKDEYGITLRAEPDHKALGARLKGDFKAVAEALRALTSAQCEELVARGGAELAGQRVEAGEVRVLVRAGASARYEAHGDDDALVLLDVTPDRDMLDEGFAREIINRIQKLRKKARLVPTDEINVYYGVEDGSDVERIIRSRKEFIENALKAPLAPRDEMSPSLRVIIQAAEELKGAPLALAVTARAAETGGALAPAEPWLNVELRGAPRLGARGRRALLLLRDEHGAALCEERLRDEVRLVFGLHGVPLALWSGGAPVRDVSALVGKTVVAVAPGAPAPAPVADDAAAGRPFCQFVNIRSDAQTTTVILENPVGDFIVDKARALKIASARLGIDQSKLRL